MKKFLSIPSNKGGLLLGLWFFMAACAVKTASTVPVGASNTSSSAPIPETIVSPVVAPQEKHTAINILFLGDNGSHKPAERLQLVTSYFSKKGINIFYSDRQEDLNLNTLKNYDVLMLYGARLNLTRAQETALYAFANGGKGIVAMHSGGGLFKESDAFISLIGGSFKSHGVGTFRTKDIAPNHPVMKGVPNFESWDETYIHMKHNPDKTVLSLMVEGDHEEPWTWVRNQGKGRVFYTAWGHDYRTWNNEGFRKLIENAVRWTAGDWALNADFSLPAFSYGNDELMIAQFGQAWNRTATPANTTKLQLDLPKTDATKYVIAEPEFRVELFASDPDIIKVIDMAWDEQGRLWVLESVDYPNDFLPNRVGHDRIKILEDTNADNKADKITVFAEGLNMPSSLVLYKGGAIIAQAPEIIFLKDSNADGIADAREVLFTGFGKSDSHQVANNLQYGFDNQIWGAVGGSGFDGTVSGEKFTFRYGMYRFLPDGSKFDLVSHTSNNTWGLGFNEEGEVFASTANGNPAVHSVIPNKFYTNINGVKGKNFIIPSIALSNRVYPLVDKVRQIDNAGGFTAASGFHIYTARDFPRDYWNRIAFVSEPTVHVLAKFILDQSGSTYTARSARNMLASQDEWFASVQSKVGPDGALWVVDWHNLYVTHNSSVVPGGSPQGEGRASTSPLRDKEHARIYRVVYKEGNSNSKNFNLKNASVDKLVNTLKSDNLFWRLTAQRLLVERGNVDVLPQLYKLVQDESIDELGLNPGALHAIWTMQGLGVLNGTNPDALKVAVDALNHSATSVRTSVLKVLPRTQEMLDKIIAADFLPVIEPNKAGTTSGVAINYRVLSDPKGLVATLLAVAEMPASEKVGNAAAEILAMPLKASDSGIRDAITAAGVQNQKAFLDRIFIKKLPANSEANYKLNVQTAVQNIAMNYTASNETQLIVNYLLLLGQTDATIGTAFVSGAAIGWPQDKAPSISTSDKEKLKKLSAALPETYKESLAALAKKWGSPDLFGNK
jgi:uncharacterized protein